MDIFSWLSAETAVPNSVVVVIFLVVTAVLLFANWALNDAIARLSKSTENYTKMIAALKALGKEHLLD